MTEDQTADRVQIHYTMAVYCNSVDSGDVEGVVSAFMPDGHLELSSGTKAAGRDAIRAFYTPVIGPDRPDRGPDGALRSIVERTGIAPEDVGPGRPFSGDEIVSLNCWGFTPALFAGLDAQLGDFLRARGTEPKAEFYLPAAVSTMIGRGEAGVRVLQTESTWFGVTYREDKPRVQAAIAELVASGAYPARWF